MPTTMGPPQPPQIKKKVTGGKKKLMVQLQIFIAINYLRYIFDNDKQQNWNKNFKFLFHSFEFGKNVITEILGRLLIGQKDSLGILLLVDICIEYKKSRNDLTDTYGGKDYWILIVMHII